MTKSQPTTCSIATTSDMVEAPVGGCIDSRGLARSAVFNQIVQALIELVHEGLGGTLSPGVGEQPPCRPRGLQAPRQRQLEFGEAER